MYVHSINLYASGFHHMRALVTHKKAFSKKIHKSIQEAFVIQPKKKIKHIFKFHIRISEYTEAGAEFSLNEK